MRKRQLHAAMPVIVQRFIEIRTCDRCFHCKRKLMQQLCFESRSHGDRMAADGGGAHGNIRCGVQKGDVCELVLVKIFCTERTLPDFVEVLLQFRHSKGRVFRVRWFEKMIQVCTSKKVELRSVG